MVLTVDPIRPESERPAPPPSWPPCPDILSQPLSPVACIPHKPSGSTAIVARAVFNLSGVPETNTRTATLPGVRRAQNFLAPGVFVDSSVSRLRRKRDLIRPTVATLDIDFCDVVGWDVDGIELPAEWTDRETAKASLYSMTGENARRLAVSSGWLALVWRLLSRTGLPAPRAVIWTGHGLLLVFTLDFAPERAPGRWKRFVDSLPAALADSNAKDLGTRLVAIPGTMHRNADKYVTLHYFDEHAPCIGGFIAAVPDATPARSQRGNGAKKPTKTTTNGASSSSMVRWVTIPRPAPPGNRVACPRGCGGNTSYRVDSGVGRCWRCLHVWFAPPVFDGWGEGAVIENAAMNGPYVDLPEVLPDTRCVVLSTPLGSGKTRAVTRYTRYARARKQPVVVVAPTQTLAIEAGKRHGLPVWVDGQNGRLADIPAGSGAVICLASVHRRVTCELPPNLLVVVDETETIASQVAGSMFKNERQYATFAAFRRLLSGASRVVLCDAFADAPTARLATMAGGAPRVYVASAPPSITVIDGDRRDDVHTTRVFDDIARLAAQREAGARMGDGNAVAVYIYSKQRARAFARKVQAKHPGLKVLVVTGADTEQEHAEIERNGVLADVLVYNNAMSTGVSIDPGWYGVVHALCCGAGASQTVSAPDLLQAVARVRGSQHKVFASLPGGEARAVDENTVMEQLSTVWRSGGIYADTEAFPLWTQLNELGIDCLLRFNRAGAGRFVAALEKIAVVDIIDADGFATEQTKATAQSVRDAVVAEKTRWADVIARAKPIERPRGVNALPEDEATRAGWERYDMEGLFGRAFTDEDTETRARMVLQRDTIQRRADVAAHLIACQTKQGDENARAIEQSERSTTPQTRWTSQRAQANYIAPAVEYVRRYALDRPLTQDDYEAIDTLLQGGEAAPPQGAKTPGGRARQAIRLYGADIAKTPEGYVVTRAAMKRGDRRAEVRAREIIHGKPARSPW